MSDCGGSRWAVGLLNCLFLPFLEDDVNNDWNKSIILHTVYKLTSSHTCKGPDNVPPSPHRVTWHHSPQNWRQRRTSMSTEPETERISQFHHFLCSINGLLTSFHLNKWVYWFSEGQNVFFFLLSIVCTVLSCIVLHNVFSLAGQALWFIRRSIHMMDLLWTYIFFSFFYFFYFFPPCCFIAHTVPNSKVHASGSLEANLSMSP